MTQCAYKDCEDEASGFYLLTEVLSVDSVRAEAAKVGLDRPLPLCDYHARAYHATPVRTPDE